MRHKERKKIIAFLDSFEKLKDCTNEKLHKELVRQIMLKYNYVMNKASAEQRDSYEKALRTMWIRDLTHTLLDWQTRYEMVKITEVF